MNNTGRTGGLAAAIVAAVVVVSHQTGAIGRILGESNAWKSLGRSLSAVDQDLPELRTSYTVARDSGGDDAYLAGVLCDAAAAAVNQEPDSVSEFIDGELESAATGGLSDKLDQFEAGLRLSEWHPGVALKYVQACLPRT